MVIIIIIISFWPKNQATRECRTLMAAVISTLTWAPTAEFRYESFTSPISSPMPQCCQYLTNSLGQSEKGFLSYKIPSKMEVAPRYKLLTLLALFILWKLLDTTKTLECMPIYDRVAPVVETVQWRSNFQSGSRVLKKVLWIIFLSFSMAYNVIYAEKLLKSHKFWKPLNPLSLLLSAIVLIGMKYEL